LHSFIEKKESINAQNAQTIANLKKKTLEKFIFAFSCQEKSKFPYQP
jgi:hypothetical protein